jgi:site-specific DNA recombinase
VVIRLIYKLFLEGKTPSGIARHLTNSSISTPSGKAKWVTSTVESILSNEKYKGDAILQKRFTVDFLTKKMKINEGEVPQYYVQNSHPAIISSEVFNLAQNEKKQRSCRRAYTTGASCFSSKIICGECGSFYGSKVWHSTSKYRRTIWQCNQKFHNEEKCRTPHLYEDALKQAFKDAFNTLIDNKAAIIKDYETIVATLTDTSALEAENEKLLAERAIVLELMQKGVDENAHSALDQADYIRRYSALEERYETVKTGLAEISDEVLERTAKRENIAAFLKTLEHSGTLLTEFDEALWNATVESVTVHSEHELSFVFKDGSEVVWKV